MAEQPKARFIRMDRRALAKLTTQMIVPMVEAATRTGRDAVVRQIDPGPSRTGRQYYKPGTRTLYTASAPGEPPAIREGLLRDSFQSDPPVILGQTVVGHIFSDRVVESENGNRWFLAWLLDQGTDKIKPRPFIDAGIEDARKQINKLVRGAI